MKIHLPRRQLRKLARELRKAGPREIGGVLAGECIGPDEFRLVDFSVQHTGGSIASFVRDPAEHAAFMNDFFERTNRQYERFNYLGEWHSHPSFEPLPSHADVRTMHALVDDPALGATFAILLIAKLDEAGRLVMSSACFRPGIRPEPVLLLPPRLPDIPFMRGGATKRWVQVGRRPSPRSAHKEV